MSRFREAVMRFKVAFQTYINEVVPQMIQAKAAMNPLPVKRLVDYFKKLNASPYASSSMMVRRICMLSIRWKINNFQLDFVDIIYRYKTKTNQWTKQNKDKDKKKQNKKKGPCVIKKATQSFAWISFVT